MKFGRHPSPFRYVGHLRQRRRIPLIALEAERAARITVSERDLTRVPTPISGGDRKALSKGIRAQQLQQQLTETQRSKNRRRQVETGLVAFKCRCGMCNYLELDEYETAEPALWCTRCMRSFAA